MKQSAEADDAPLYVRWEPQTLGFAIEMRLDVMARMQREVAAARESGVEVGGVFLGRLPMAAMPTLRIDDVMPIPRRAEDGPIFMLDPGEHDRFLTTRWDAKSQGQLAVGFYRTHVRPGPLRLSLADRTLVTGHFTKEAMVVMLVGSKPPHRAALFAGLGTRLPSEPSIPEFAVDEEAFRSLPEIDFGQARPRSRGVLGSLFWALCVIVVLGVAGFAYRSWNNVASFIPGGQSQGPNLRVKGGQTVTVDWDHYSGDVRKAASAKLTISDGTIRRDLTLGADALRLGAVEYEPRTPVVNVTLTLYRPDASSVMQSAEWRGKTGE